jgi:outer membrane protein assembly factor BamD (BamD/ComL family)
MRCFLLVLSIACACGGTKANTQPGSSAGKHAGSLAGSSEETALMERIRQNVKANPQAAVDFADEAERRFPESPLREERESMAIDALINLQKFGSARGRAEFFLRRYPNGKYAAHVGNMTGMHVTPSGPPPK